MINVWTVLANSLWILGVAVLLAIVSWAYWVANTQGDRFRTVMNLPRTQQALNGAAFLFCVGLAATSRIWWEQLLWGLLAAAWAVRALLKRLNTSKTGTHKRGMDNANPDNNSL
jgi:hypothetical protein